MDQGLNELMINRTRTFDVTSQTLLNLGQRRDELVYGNYLRFNEFVAEEIIFWKKGVP